jgi:hypothetical protein
MKGACASYRKLYTGAWIFDRHSFEDVWAPSPNLIPGKPSRHDTVVFFHAGGSLDGLKYEMARVALM